MSLPWELPPDLDVACRLNELADEILGRCRGEGPPNCVARCPLGVDAPTYLRLARQGRYREALQKVRERLPFPGIMGYICTAPCEWHCKRLDEDAPVKIREVKRFLAEQEEGEPEHVLSREPRKGRRIAVVGSGPAGLMVAHDLRRRGFDVLLLDEAEGIGGCLTGRIPAWRLPPRVAERDLSVIPALGIEARTGVAVGRDASLAELRRECDAVVFCGGIAGAARLAAASGLPVSDDRFFFSGDVMRASRLDGIFAAGTAVLGPVSVVEAMAHGRAVAAQVAAHLVPSSRREVGASPTTQRVRWRLEVGEEERRRRVPAVDLLAPAGPALDEPQVRREGERCLQCSCRICVDECDFLARYCNSPMELARQVQGQVQAHLAMVYSCTLCGLCAEVCPENLPTGSLLLQARRVAVAQEAAPLAAHAELLTAFRDAVRPRAALVMSEPGRSRTRRLFFPGCTWPVASPTVVAATYDLLRAALPGLGVLLYCCGSPLLALGMEEELSRHLESLSRMIEESGADEVVAACPGCTSLLRERLPAVTTSTAWEVLARVWTPTARREGVEVTIQDSCRGRCDVGAQRAVRRLLEASGAKVREVEYSGRRTRCCGRGGGVMAVDAELAHRITARRVSEAPGPWVTACAGCRHTLAGGGVAAVHLMEFLLDDDWERKSWQSPPSGLSAVGNRARTRYLLRRRRPLAGG